MSMWKTMTLGFTIAGLAGCSGAGGSSSGEPQTQDQDIAGYETLQADLEGKRKVFLEGPAQDFTTAGNTLFWIEAAVGDPLLHSYDAASKQTTNYGFKVYLTGPSNPNPIDNVNYVASTSLIATMNQLDGANTYAVGSEKSELGKLTLPAPPYGQKWWAYGVNGGDVYVTIILDEKYHLQRWTPGDAMPTDVAILDDLIAPNKMGEFHNFAVSGETLIFDEGNRIWLAQLTDAKAKWAKNEKHVGGVDFYAGGAVYSEGAEFWRYDAAKDTRENLSEKMRGGAYELNKTFAEAHHPASNSTWVKRGNTIVYEANFGIFSYDLDAATVEPLLLSARDNSIVYKYPTALENGTLFVKGLVSSSGSIGADGPTYTLAP